MKAPASPQAPRARIPAIALLTAAVLALCSLVELLSCWRVSRQADHQVTAAMARIAAADAVEEAQDASNPRAARSALARLREITTSEPAQVKLLAAIETSGLDDDSTERMLRTYRKAERAHIGEIRRRSERPLEESGAAAALLGVLACLSGVAGGLVWRRRALLLAADEMAARRDKDAATIRARELQAELAHVARLAAMGQMASVLAHELNQPLSGAANYVQGAIRTLESDAGNLARIREGMDRANAQILRAGDIIRHLRALVAKGATERAVENLSVLLAEAGELSIAVRRAPNLKLSYRIEVPDVPVLVDKFQIQHAVISLMRNGIDAMADTPRQELTISVTAAPQDMIRVSVRDTGLGVSPEIAGSLFDPFVTTKPTGMGVGLSISRTIIESHGGRIWAEPAQDGGAVFSFTLPIAKG